MPHQRLAADIGGEIDPETGLFAYRMIVLTWPRQTGKSIFVVAYETERCLLWDQKQKVLYTAQTGTDARDKLFDEVDGHYPILRDHIGKYLIRPKLAKGEEAIRFANGSEIALAASSDKSGHGGTIDLGVLDECWADTDNRREQTIRPMIKTKPMAQILAVSTQGTDKSVYLNRLTEIGRAAAAADRGHGICYIEYSVPEDEDVSDPDVWWRYMPGLGYTITEDAIRSDFEQMEESEFRRADCNQCQRDADDRVIPEATWAAVQNARANIDRRAGRVSFGIDVHPDRGSAAIAVSDGTVVGVIEHREGTGWVRERVRQLREKWGGRFAIDGGGPAVSLADDLEQLDHIQVTRLSNAEWVAACSRMYDSLADQQVIVRTDERLDAAVQGLAKRPVGDRFVWDRRVSAADITPFVAATLALSVSPERKTEPLAAWT